MFQPGIAQEALDRVAGHRKGELRVAHRFEYPVRDEARADPCSRLWVRPKLDGEGPHGRAPARTAGQTARTTGAELATIVFCSSVSNRANLAFKSFWMTPSSAFWAGLSFKSSMSGGGRTCPSSNRGGPCPGIGRIPPFPGRPGGDWAMANVPGESRVECTSDHDQDRAAFHELSSKGTRR